MYDQKRGGPIDRFCTKHPRFGIPNLMKIIVFTQIGVYLIDLLCRFVLKTSWLTMLEFIPLNIFQGQLWRLVTWLVVPNSDNPFYLLLGCYFYYWIASMLERQWGTPRFNLFYFGGAILSVIAGLLVGLLQRNLTHTYSIIDLSYYLNLSIFLVLATLFGDAQVLLLFVVPVKMKWMALLDLIPIVISMVRAVRAGYWMLALAPLASWINYFIFTWPYWQAKLSRAKYRHDPKVIQFKQAQKQAQKAQKAQQSQPWHHKCAVCGITDLDDPNMEFRYCSKCDGYYCYCANHINNHVHIHNS